MPEVDLNLLRVFDLLMELRSVTRVAERLGLTQSAVSHALGRLRRLLDDPLFVRGPQGLQPSARAEQIAPDIRASLQQMREALVPLRFDPASAERRFTIAASSYFCTLMMPPLLARLRRDAARVELRVVPLIEDGTAMLDGGGIDLAFRVAQDLASRFAVAPLFDDEMVWIAARTNPIIAKAPNLAQILRLPRVRISARRSLPASSMPGEEGPLALTAWDPDPAGDAPVMVYDSHTATELVARTDLVACVPRRIAEQERNRGDIAVLTRASTGVLRLEMIWHSRNRSDTALAWLRDLVSQIVGGFA